MNENETTLEYYRKRIKRMVTYIDEHLDENPSLEILACAAGFSPYHFHRIAKAFLGETIGSFIVRKRVETAARMLRNTDLPIKKIAYNVGYDVPSSLTKAFKLFYGISPNDFRNNKDNLIMKEVKFSPTFDLDERVEMLKEKNVICYSLQGDYLTCDYEKAWGVIMKYANDNKLDLGSIEYLSIYYDDPCVTEASKQRADVCITIDKSAKPANGLSIKQIAGGKYAIYLYKGTYNMLGAVYDTIFKKYIPKHDYKLDERPMFEKYLNDPSTTKPEELLTEIYLPIV